MGMLTVSHHDAIASLHLVAELATPAGPSGSIRVKEAAVWLKKRFIQFNLISCLCLLDKDLRIKTRIK